MSADTIAYIIIVIIFLGIMIYSYRKDEKERAEKEKHTSEQTDQFLNSIRQYSDKPHMMYRSMISSEELKKKFDEEIKKPEYKEILDNLKPNEISDALLELVLNIEKDDPKIQKKVDDLLKKKLSQ